MEDPAKDMLRFFEFAHLPENLHAVGGEIWATANTMISLLPPGPEKTMGLRKLLEAKDCFVRANL